MPNRLTLMMLDGLRMTWILPSFEILNCVLMAKGEPGLPETLTSTVQSLGASTQYLKERAHVSSRKAVDHPGGYQPEHTM
eukprot:6176163-Pleurochrysis_carterae.AAC.2